MNMFWVFWRYWKAFCEGMREGIEEELNRIDRKR